MLLLLMLVCTDGGWRWYSGAVWCADAGGSWLVPLGRQRRQQSLRHHRQRRRKGVHVRTVMKSCDLRSRKWKFNIVNYALKIRRSCYSEHLSFCSVHSRSWPLGLRCMVAPMWLRLGLQNFLIRVPGSCSVMTMLCDSSKEYKLIRVTRMMNPQCIMNRTSGKAATLWILF